MTTKNQTKDQVNETYEQAEQFMNTVWNANRHAFSSLLEFQRKNLDTGLEMTRHFQEESLRFTDQWVDQISKLQKNTVKSLQDYTHRVQDTTEKVVREQQSRLEQSVERSMDLAAAAKRN